jgi:hypothetical protein
MGSITVDGVEIHEARYVSANDWQELHTPEWMASFMPHLLAWREAGGGARFTKPSWRPL